MKLIFTKESTIYNISNNYDILINGNKIGMLNNNNKDLYLEYNGTINYIQCATKIIKIISKFRLYSTNKIDLKI